MNVVETASLVLNIDLDRKPGHNADADEAENVDYTVLCVEQQRAAVGSMCDGPSKPR